jgi:hypothetical protein
MMQPHTKEKEEQELKSNSMYMVINALTQFFAFFAYTQYAIFWPYYIVIGMLSILILIQTIGAAAVWAGYQNEKKSRKTDDSMLFLISIVYLVSCYQLYIAGYTIFSVVAFTHVAIISFAAILRSIK